MTLPILYSLRNCPYAMRARMAIYKSKQVVELRELVLKNKPLAMLETSPKGTVPILVLRYGLDTKVVDESLDIMLWALGENDPSQLLRTTPSVNEYHSITSKGAQTCDDMMKLINRFDQEFKGCLEAYKCAKRYHETNLQACREACEVYVQDLEQRLSQHDYLIDERESMADIALLPFIRQFAKVQRQWYLQAQYPHLKRWLNQYLQSAMFNKVMAKYPLWCEGQGATLFNFG
ncbi:glutathione S-transferase [Paraglaciecola aquimarina]|uniref:Glutathione S-transferase n=1 Tax=Paraglaciecola aquimarina TaxID=1235557 RepID=A0ABU3SZ08_9ALTE|nr:glutathione S-transferase [Paraglaciecola aquimarina]MDU0355235.1 glutathione S-transferase [Paraglaciecola aquimarina]